MYSTCTMSYVMQKTQFTIHHLIWLYLNAHAYECYYAGSREGQTGPIESKTHERYQVESGMGLEY